MAITLVYSGTTITLPEDLYWSDEFSWQPVEQTQTYGITGSLIVQSAERQAGRPITLTPEDAASAWMKRDMLETLRSWAAVPGRVMALTLRGVTRDVIFRRENGSAIEATPVVHYNDTDNSDNYRATLRLMEI